MAGSGERRERFANASGRTIERVYGPDDLPDFDYDRQLGDPGVHPFTRGLYPDGYRARAFGVMASGVQVIQGFAVIVTGLLAERFAIPSVVGYWSLAGVFLMLVVTSRLPSANAFDAALATARQATPAPRGEVPGERSAPAAAPPPCDPARRAPV